MVEFKYKSILGMSSNFMEHKILFLVLLFLSISIPTHVRSTEEGFVAVEIYNKGIDFAKDLLLNKALSSLTPLELPEIEKPAKIPLVGTVHITLSNVVLYEIDVSAATIVTGDTGINVVVSGAKAYVNMDWSYTYGKLIVIKDNGIASVEVKGMEVGLTAGLKNQRGTLELSLLDSGCHVTDLSIKLDGGASWLYQVLVDAFENKVRSAIEDAISQKIEDEFIALDTSLQSLPKEIAVDDISILNVTFVDDVVVSNSAIGLKIDGLFTARDEVIAFDNYARNSRAAVFCEGLAKMVGISIHENVLKSASLVYFNADVMHWTVDNIPDQFLLNTAEWRLVIPDLYKQYPNDDMNLNVSITSPPIIKVSAQNIDVAIDSEVTIDVLDAGQVVSVACIASGITVSAYPEISRNNLAGRVELNDFTMSLKWSKIGNLHMDLLQPVIHTALQSILLPYVNLILWKGFPLPDFQGYTLHNAQFRYIDSRIIVCSDIASVKQQILEPLMIYDN